ncbi:tRNA pseudouridine(38-40) synthase TruA [Formosa sediminum]|uniref:tRNA pseudouridine synthase A n=1 Tax=Formosa sediminum TaxID=2594004 RepID=A0A516GM93_9FLAO|nr:tRNA pseudouridine(38-40) synthase TruA [Formosa sediminum]QDO92639.1 tRNA pseudouridine(38-40) synthase TruA [Formosa sediminum]
MRYFLELSYNGTAYHGWQNQPNARSVQEVIETALSVILKEKIAIMGAGRTDSGVHAKQMFAHVDVSAELDTETLRYKLNSYLPKDIAIHHIFKVKADAHARFHATSRTYLYRIALQKNVFNFDNAYFVKQKLNIENMIAAANMLLSYSDFECFSKSNTDVKTYLCNITAVHLEMVDTELHFTITADRFLRNMVRAIMGTLINVGLGKLEVDDMHRIISSKKRSEAGYSVPAKGLYLTHITYPESIKL